MSDSNLPVLGRVGEVAPPREWDGFVRIVIETSDAGPDVTEAVRWVMEWAAKAAEDAPFHVDHLHVEGVDRCEVADV